MANPTVGGAEMFPAKTIAENASAAPNLTTLVAAVIGRRSGRNARQPRPIHRVCAHQHAFEKLPAGTVGTLVKPENKATLTAILTYHVVAGKLTSKDIVTAIKAGGGKATLDYRCGWQADRTSLSGNSDVIVTDAQGRQSAVTTVDVMQSNGVVHVIDSVLLP